MYIIRLIKQFVSITFGYFSQPGKKLYILFAFSLIIVALNTQGCTDQLRFGNSFLKEPPSVGTTKDSVFSSAKRANEFLANGYSSLPFGPGTPVSPGVDQRNRSEFLASLTDINQTFLPWGGVIDTYYNNAGYPWRTMFDKYNFKAKEWDGIRKAYLFIENVDDVPDMTEDMKKRRKAEAQMIVAEHYSQMFRNFGGLPWVNHAFKPNESFDLKRLTAKATLDSMVALMDEAIPQLPFALKNPKEDAGRFTAAGAMGLKCRTLLFGASPLFNSNEPYLGGEAAQERMIWYGKKDPSLWVQAKDACGNLIDKIEQTGDYQLVDTGNPREDFRKAYLKRSSTEMLLSNRQWYKSPSHTFSGGYYGQYHAGAGATTDNYVKMFPMADGTPIKKSGSGYDKKHPYENRDPRLYESVLVNGDKYQGRKAKTWLGGQDRPNKNTKKIRYGYVMRKWIPEGTQSFGMENWQWSFLRLPEIYLSYAEALTEVNGKPTNEAYKYVNKVRNRVDLGDLPTGMGKQEFIKATLRERVLELGYEDVRWYDIVRRKLKRVFTKTLYGMDICKKNSQYPTGPCNEPGSYESQDFIYHQVKLPERHWKNNFSPKWYLSPFPQDEVRKGYLVQNPGWKL